ncbi:gephyrin-like molybdotransferase Glp [Ensifer sp. P24N7]|uniref:molybdopterin molybdotransferase MoeA n=1 Tax=Sinorhizobium sp. P24N7 TaxID=3348358 RepID=UPI0035F396BB
MKANVGRRDQDETIADCGSGGQPKRHLSVEEAVLAASSVALPVADVERLDLLTASGRVLGTPAVAGFDLPRFDHSAMDGYAVQSAGFDGHGPWTLSVADSVAAGNSVAGLEVGPGDAVAINTGAPIPPGCDAVVINERCLRSNNVVVIAHRPRSGENVRKAGEDIGSGAIAAARGSLITPHVAAMLAALGMAKVDVLRRVRVAIVTTGAELRQPGERLGEGQIYDSNRFLVRSMLNLPWICLTDAGNVTDRFDDVSGALFDLSRDNDVVISTGGMSHGAADFVRSALAAHGASLSVINVAMRPGKPATIGRLGPALFIGLPGNPMAAAIALRQIAFPAIRVTGGFGPTDPVWFPATSGFDYRKRQGRTEFVPVAIAGRDDEGMPLLRLLGRGSSGSLSPLAQADGIAVLPSEASDVRAGMRLRYEPLNACG